MPRLSIVGSERESAAASGVAGADRGGGESRAAALPHLRQRRRRQEHADRPAALQFSAGLRGPAAKRRAATSSARARSASGALDLALLVDGLQAEREQKITIDVAYRYFSTPRRKFIVADTPGHVQYTRNMATGASNCDFAVLLVDARSGVLTQTRRHACILSLLGIRKVALAVNKMDLVDFDQARFEAIADDFASFVEPLRIRASDLYPGLGAQGRQRDRSERASALVSRPDAARASRDGRCRSRGGAERPFRFPVQWVNRPHLDFRGYAGTVASGAIRPGEEVVIHPSGKRAHVARIVTADGDLDEAREGDAVTLTFAEEVDVSRGDIDRASPTATPSVADQIAARLIWFDEEPMLPGRTYTLKCGCQTTTATISSLKYKLNVDNLDHVAGKTLELNEVGSCNLTTAKALVFDPYAENAETGSLHPDRPLHQCDGRRGHDRVRLAPRHQHPVAGAVRRQAARGRR